MNDPNDASTGRAGGERAPKRKRLSHACKACRARKVRCDERLPACTNCAKLRIQCITDDPRRPHIRSVTRSRASGSRTSSTLHADHQPQAHQPDSTAVTQSKQNDAPAAVPHEDEQHGSRASSPWADPTWMRNALGSTSASIISDSHAQDRFKYVGSSNLQVFSNWIDLLLARQRNTTSTHARKPLPSASISDHFDHGRIHSEEFHFALRPALPGLTPLRHIDAILEAFFDNANSVFPIFDEALLRHQLARLIQHLRLDDPSAMQLDSLSPYEVPMLATLYVVTAFGLLDVVPRQQPEVKKYLDAAYSLYGHMIGVPYLASVQALLVLHLALRAMSKDGAAWQTLGSAIRVAYSIGLHRGPVSPPLHSPALESTKARVWWCCYVLDRVATLDSGRPTMINDLDVQLSALRIPRQPASDLVAASSADDPASMTSLPDDLFNERYLASLVALCRLKADIHSKLYTSRNHSLAEADLFATIAKMDAKLMDWSSSCLVHLRLPTMASEEALRAVSKSRDLRVLHLLCTYHFTLINVHRASVMLDTRLYQHHVAQTLTKRSDRLLSAETICRGSARTIIRCINQFRLLHHSTARMIAGTIPLSAVYVLAICIFKHPKQWSVASDLALIESIAKTVAQDFENDGMPAGFTSIFATLQQLATQCVRHVSSRPSSPPLADLDTLQAQVSLEPFWKSLGFGQVVSSVGDETQSSQPAATNFVSPADSTANAARPAYATEDSDEVPSFQSLLELDHPDQLLYSLLGLPEIFTPGAEASVETGLLGLDEPET
ncbi:fungal specific transcription factor domain-containing protein [Moesziomyces aphidis]|uniref:Fungal specific transcription factor domain-containing protein n=1 Tax=Moesziomyces aphidis TaxID=84754 RepID=W3VCS3_MOEAP|nr:fungal specific transcription factor domain-containing protein [Moesziomyces aphidis]